MGNNSSRTETINWDKIKTDNVSPPELYLGSNTNKANSLITKLNLPKEITRNLGTGTESETDIDLFDKSFLTKNFININELNSSTSPFISSEKYLSLTKKLQNNLNQVGGALDDESSTSVTENDENQKNTKIKSKFNSVLSELSYVSSSAHTGNDNESSENNDNDESENNDNDESDNSNETTVDDKIKKKNNKMKKGKSESSDDSDDSDDIDDSDNDDDDDLGNSTVYSTTIDNEVNTSDINLV